MAEYSHKIPASEEEATTDTHKNLRVFQDGVWQRLQIMGNGNVVVFKSIHKVILVSNISV